MEICRDIKLFEDCIYIVRNKSIFKYYQLSQSRKLRVIVSIQTCQKIIKKYLLKQTNKNRRGKNFNSKMKLNKLIMMKNRMKTLIRQMIFTNQSLHGEEVTIKKVHSREEAIVNITIIHTREEALSLLEVIEVVAMHREPHTKNLTIKIKITKLMKKTPRKCKKRERPTTEVEVLIKRMVNMFREVEEEETIGALSEEEGGMRVNTKNIMNIEVAIIIIKKIGKVVEVVIRNSKKTKLNINPIMKIINPSKIVMKRILLNLLLTLN